MKQRRTVIGFIAAALAGLVAAPAQAQEVVALGDGDTAWLITATALVLFMTLPGLALFYGGLVRARNVLSVLMHCFTICCLASVLWLVFVYSLAFGDGGPANAFIGGLGKAFLAGVGADTLAGTIPESVFFMFQMTFAIITPALIVGAYVERIKFTAMAWFTGLWLVFVYAPVAHWVWGGGWLAQMGVMDFAGGLVVHTTAGVAALVATMVMRARVGFPDHVRPPHSPGMTMMGAAMLWVGWFGFNAGSALAADGSAGMAMAVTHISAATASLTWMSVEWVKHGRPTLIGLVTGTIAGLATITPASGFVGPAGALVIGFVAGLACYGAVQVVKGRLRIDDSLDVMAVHGVGGMTGILLTAFFVSAALGGMGLPAGVGLAGAVWVQFVGVVATAAWTGLVTWIIVKAIDLWIGLTVAEDQEIEGLDLTTHGEKGYEF